MALAQQGKHVDEKLLNNYENRGILYETYITERYTSYFFLRLELPIPTIGTLNELEDRLIRILRSEQGSNELCFRYGDLCSLDTIQVDVAPDKKGIQFIHNNKKQNVLFFRCYNTTF